MIRINKSIYFAIVAVFAVSIYYILTTVPFVRLWADDFCSSVFLRNNGYFNSQIMWWKGWTGRYSYIAFLDFVELFGLTGAKILPILLVLLFTIPALLMAGSFGLLFAPIILVNSPNIIQSFYWMTGSLNYFAPFVFLNFYLLLLFKPLKNKKYNYILSFLLLFIAAGFSEAFGLANILFLVLLFFVFTNTNSRKLIAVGIFATILSLGLMFLAPGNAARSATVSHPESLIELIKSTLVYSKWYLVHLFYIKSFVISVLSILTASFVFLKTKVKYFENPKLVIASSFVFMIAVTLSVVGLTYQAMNWEPPERVMSIVNNFILMSIVFGSMALFQIVGSKVPKLVSKILFIVAMVFLIYQLNNDWSNVRKEMSDYANNWDRVDEILISSDKAKAVSVPNIQSVGKLDGFTENKGWVLGCIKAYYGTGDIIVE